MTFAASVEMRKVNCLGRQFQKGRSRQIVLTKESTVIKMWGHAPVPAQRVRQRTNFG